MTLRPIQVLGMVGLAIILTAWLSGDGGVLPDPTPEPGARTVVVVEESADRPTWLATIILSSDVRDYCENKGHLFRVVDDDVVAERTQPYIDAATERPALVVGKADYGEVIDAVPMPRNAADTIQAIKAAGG